MKIKNIVLVIFWICVLLSILFIPQIGVIVAVLAALAFASKRIIIKRIPRK